jgi:hypothetical protein
MKKVVYPILFLLFFGGSMQRANAVWIMGSDLTWTCIGQDSFLIKFVVYADCNSTGLGNYPITFKCASSRDTITSVLLNWTNPVEVTPVCKSSCTRCQSSSCTFPYGIRRFTMQGIANLNAAGSCCNIIMSWGHCCRGGNITTISNAGAVPLYTEAKLNRCLNPCDNSPTFSNAPVAIICAGQPFTYNPGTVDKDVKGAGGLSDSFTYEWAKPLWDSGIYISYLSPYAYNIPINFYGFPNAALPWPTRGFHLDPQTGDVLFQPMWPEVTIMVLQVNEFRNGVKIAELRHEIEIIVLACMNPPSVSTPGVQSKYVCSGETVIFNFTTSDPDSNDTVRISWNKAIPGAIWTDSNGLSRHPSAKLTWVPTANYVSTLPYTFTVTVEDNACPIKASNTHAYQIRVLPKPQATISIADSGCGNYWFKANKILGSNPVYVWQGKSFSFTPGKDSVVQHKFQPGIYPYAMTMTANGCSTTYFDTASITGDSVLSVILPADTAICLGNSISITPKIIFGQGAIKYHWSNGYTNKILNYGPINYNRILTLIVTDTTVCKASDTIVISTLKNPEVTPGSPVDICYSGRYNVNLYPPFGVFGSNNYVSSYNWHMYGDTTTLSNTSVLSTKDTGIFVFTIKDKFGCIASNSFSILNSIKKPEITLNDIDICYNINNKYQVKIIPVYQVFGTNNYVSNFNWHKLGDTTTLSKMPELNTNDTGIYVFSIADKFGCLDLDSLSILNSIKKPEITLNNIDICYSGNKKYPVKIIPVYQVFGSNNFITSFNWHKLGDSTTLSNMPELNTNDTGIYVFSIADKFGCLDLDSLSILNSINRPEITMNHNAIICYNNIISTKITPVYKVFGSNNYASSFKWQFLGDSTTLSVKKDLSTKDTGTYKFTVTDKFGCLASDSIKVELTKQIDTSLQVKDSLLTASPGMKGYKWYRNDTLVSSAGNFFIATVNGSYYVILTDSNDCVDKSRKVIINLIDINQQHLKGSLKLYPNPTTGKLVLETDEQINGEINLIITNIYGREIINRTVKSNDIQTANEINISDQPAGIYTIVIKYQNNNFHQLIIKE